MLLKFKAIYAKQIETFKRNLTEEQVLAIKNERKRLEYELTEKKVRNERKNVMTSLGKPKKPMTSYFLFRKEFIGIQGETTATVAAKWAKLSENEKSVYIKKGDELRAKYKLVFFLSVFTFDEMIMTIMNISNFQQRYRSMGKTNDFTGK